MRVTNEFIFTILRIAEDIVEEETTERVFFGYDDDGQLTDAGHKAYTRIVTAFRVAELQSAFDE